LINKDGCRRGLLDWGGRGGKSAGIWAKGSRFELVAEGREEDVMVLSYCIRKNGGEKDYSAAKDKGRGNSATKRKRKGGEGRGAFFERGDLLSRKGKSGFLNF